MTRSVTRFWREPSLSPAMTRIPFAGSSTVKIRHASPPISRSENPAGASVKRPSGAPLDLAIMWPSRDQTWQEIWRS